jgi:hypothetical protein
MTVMVSWNSVPAGGSIIEQAGRHQSKECGHPMAGRSRHPGIVCAGVEGCSVSVKIHI